MTDHTAIIERMARDLFPYAFMPMSVHYSKLRRQQLIDEAMEKTERALSASGLLEVLEKAEPFDRFGKVLIEKFPSNGGHTLNGGTPEAVEIAPHGS